MRLSLSTFAAPAILASVLAILPAAAQSVGDNATQDVIRGQIEAFRTGDDARAFSFASPNIQRMFGTSDRFISMVKQGYQPVYAPRDFTFGRAVDRDGTVFQEVLVTGPKGKEWIALYTLERQQDGSLRISGCRIAEHEAFAI